MGGADAEAQARLAKDPIYLKFHDAIQVVEAKIVDVRRTVKEDVADRMVRSYAEELDTLRHKQTEHAKGILRATPSSVRSHRPYSPSRPNATRSSSSPGGVSFKSLSRASGFAD